MYKIDSLDHYGRGISKLNNKIVFVENALPSEIVELEIKKNRKRYLEGNVLKYIEISKDRVKPECPFYEYCGGCQIMHLNYENQLKFKQGKIENIISKYLETNTNINNIIGCDNKLNYRNKTTFQVKECIGLYKKSSYEIIEIDKCIISNSLINKSIKYLKKLDLSKISKITCRASNELMIIIETTDKDLNIEILKDIAQSIYLKIDSKYMHVFGNKYIYETLGKYKFTISPNSFFQINTNTCYKLYSKIKEYVGINKKILDLYCGTGSIGIFINENNTVLGIEINESAINDAIENKKINNLENINFICDDSGKALSKIDFNPDIIIVDPPRSGLNKETLENVLNMRPAKIIYVSCDPMTLTRDLNELSKFYIIKEITPFDMFPNTYHIESICLLERK